MLPQLMGNDDNPVAETWLESSSKGEIINIDAARLTFS